MRMKVGCRKELCYLRVFFLRYQPNAHRIPIVFTLIGPDTADDDHERGQKDDELVFDGPVNDMFKHNEFR